MADRYWVGGTGTWDGTNTANWSATSGGPSGASVPGTGDNALFDANSGPGTTVVTLGVSPNCRDFNTTGVLAGFTITHGVRTIFTRGHVTISPNLNWLATGTPLSMAATDDNGGAGYNVQTNGKTIPGGIAFSGANGNWTLLDALTATGAVSSNGSNSLKTNSQTITALSFAWTGSTARNLDLGSSSFILSSTGTVWNVRGTGLTFSPNTAVVTCTGNGCSIQIASNNGCDYNGTSFVATGTGQIDVITAASGVTTFKNFTRVLTGAVAETTTIAGFPVLTGTLTLKGNGQAVRQTFRSSTNGAPRTVTVNGSVVAESLDLMDIAAAGTTAPWNLSAIPGLSGDMGGNSGITFTPSVTQTRTGVGGNWSNAASWTSRVPLPQDDVIVGSAASGTITLDVFSLGRNLNFTGFTGTVTRNISVGIYGNLTLFAGMVWNTSTNLAFVFYGHGQHTITTAGQIVNNRGSNPGGITIDAGIGTYTLTDAMQVNTIGASAGGGITVTSGTLDTASLPVILGSSSSNFTISSGATLTLGTSVVSIYADNGVTFWNASASAVINAAQSTIVLARASIATRTFGGGGLTYGVLTYTVPNSPGPLAIGGNNPFKDLNIGPGREARFPTAGTTITGSLNASGADFDYLYLPGVAGNYATAPDSAALGITGNIDVRLRIAMDDWTSASFSHLIGQWGTGIANMAWALAVNSGSTGTLRFTFSTDGTTQVNVSSIVAPTVTDGTALWLRVTRDSATGDVKFWTASGSLTTPVAADFTQLGATVTSTTGAMFNSTGSLEIGMFNGSTSPWAGKVYRAQVRSGIDGTLAFDADLAAKAVGANTFVEGSVNAATVTINGSLAQVGDGRTSLVSSTVGTRATLSKASGSVVVEYASVQDLAATGGATFLAAFSTDAGNNTGWLFGTRLRRWDGTTWTSRTIQRWSGSAWVDKSLSWWTGSQWHRAT